MGQALEELRMEFVTSQLIGKRVDQPRIGLGSV